MTGWEAREAEIRGRVKRALAGIGIVTAQDAGDLLTEITRLRNQLRTAETRMRNIAVDCIFAARDPKWSGGDDDLDVIIRKWTP